MGKKKNAVMIVAVAVAVGSYNVCQSQNVATLSALTLANLEALTAPEIDGGGDGESSGCSNKNGYRRWSTSGFLEHKKEFYDCCFKLQEGYNPKDNCR